MFLGMLYQGLDIGGTKLGVAIADATGKILAQDRIATEAELPAGPQIEAALARLAELEQGLRKGADLPPCVALGASCPGPLDRRTGRFLDPPNMPGWHDFPILERLQELSPLPSAVMNDANASVLAECYWGAAKGAEHAVFLTMSTGMGAGLYLAGRLVEGRAGLAGEVGHLRLAEEGPVGFGKRGSVEGFLSGPGILQQAKAEALRCEQLGEATLLRDAGLSTESFFAAVRAGDAAALRVRDQVARRLGQLCAILVDLLEPELIVLGTIAIQHGDLFLEEAREWMERDALPASAAGARILASPLRSRGDLSAIAVAHHKHQQ